MDLSSPGTTPNEFQRKLSLWLYGSTQIRLETVDVHLPEWRLSSRAQQKEKGNPMVNLPSFQEDALYSNCWLWDVQYFKEVVKNYGICVEVRQSFEEITDSEEDQWAFTSQCWRHIPCSHLSVPSIAEVTYQVECMCVWYLEYSQLKLFKDEDGLFGCGGCLDNSAWDAIIAPGIQSFWKRVIIWPSSLFQTVTRKLCTIGWSQNLMN